MLVSKPYVAHITVSIAFHSNSDDPLDDFMEHNGDLAEIVAGHYGDITVTEDEMESDE